MNLIKQTLENIQKEHGDHTNYVTFTMSTGQCYQKAIQMINHEIETATNIKSRV